jgi:hypothetical protein
MEDLFLLYRLLYLDCFRAQAEQSDQIWRIFAQWVIIYFGSFFRNRTHFVFDYVLGDIFTNSSSHPEAESYSSLLRELRAAF